MSEVYKLSPLDEHHRDSDGEMVPFAGWEMPQSYSSVFVEHQAVRSNVGMFDISYMGLLFVSGNRVAKWLDALLTNEVAALEVGQSHCTLLLNEQGGVLDELILYHLAEENFLLVVNAARSLEVSEWLAKHLLDGITLSDESSEWAGLAVQGPRAPETYTRITGGRCLPARHQVDDVVHEGSRILVCRTGYTGEDGFEIFCPTHAVSQWWQLLLDEQVTPCGLGARESLRLEMGYSRGGVDLSPAHTALEAGLGHLVSLEKEIEFLGHEVLLAQQENGVSHRLSAILLGKDLAPEAGDAVFEAAGDEIGVLTSAAYSPSLECGIGLAYLPHEFSKTGTSLLVSIHGENHPAKVVKKPFYRK